MKHRPNKRFLISAAVLTTAALGAVAFAQDAPESLLPPGFGQPAPARPVQATPAAPQPAQPTATAPVLTLDPGVFAPLADVPPPVVEALELPDNARRSLVQVGPLVGFGPQAFGTMDGRFLSKMMRRLDVPIASRWASITLRRALLSRVPTPSHVRPADWIAERAWLLLRMGEADGARLLVAGVDVDNYNAKLYAVAAQTALANADAAGLCALAEGGSIRGGDAIWPMSRAICAALSGDTAIADVLMDQARRRIRDSRSIDIQLAEKMMGVNGGGQRSVSIDWTGVNELTGWRFGMASALGVTIPADLIGTVGPQVVAWQARAPMLPASERIEAALVAARIGVFSNSSLIDLYGAAGEENDDFTRDAPAGKLRACYIGDDDAARVSAMRGLWQGSSDSPNGANARFAAQILTARAAARVQPSSDLAGDVERLIGSMMTAGLDRQAARWAPVVSAMSPEKGDPAWAILAVGTERPSVDLGEARISGFAERTAEVDRHKAQMLIAALAGLGRMGATDEIQLAADYGVRFDTQSNWAKLLQQAARQKQPGTVSLLVAAGMQRGDWRAIPASMFYIMLHSLRSVGLDGEARMIAAEAMTRL